MARYQHVIPQREQDHKVRPFANGRRVEGAIRCATCQRAIHAVPANDGPEGLKALLRW